MAYDDDFTSGETVTVGPIGEGTKRRQAARKARIEANNASKAKQANRNPKLEDKTAGKGPTDSGGSGTGTVTTTKQSYKTEVKDLQLGRARVTDPHYKEVYAEEVQKRFDKYEDKNRYQIEEQEDDGTLVVYDTKTGQYKDYPQQTLEGSRDRANRRRKERSLRGKADLNYVRDVKNGEHDPPVDVKGPNYSVTRTPITTTQEVKPVGADNSGKKTIDPGIAEKEQEQYEAGVINQVPDQISGTGGGVDGYYTEDDSSVPLDTVMRDDGKVEVTTKPEVDPDFGEPIEGTGGKQYVTEEELDELKAQGRITPSDYQRAKKTLGSQRRAKEKGNWPVPDGYGINEYGDLVNLDGAIINDDGTVTKNDGAVVTNTNTQPGPPADFVQQVANSIKAPRISAGIAGVPGEHKIKLYTKNPEPLQQGTMEPLLKTGNGIIFPFSPTIQVNHSASYGTYDINQSVNQPHYYMMTPNVQINLTAIFTANTAKEASYLLAAMHFLRWSTKSDFGAYVNGNRRTDAGTPPPVLVFSGYGTEQFNNIPVIVRNFSYTLPEDVDYVTVQTQEQQVIKRDLDATFLDANGVDIKGELGDQFNAGADITADESSITKAFPNESSTIPTTMLFAIDLAPQYPPSQLRDEWNLKQYASGELLRKGYL